MITFDEIKQREDIKIYIEQSNNVLYNIGYTEHGFAHVLKVGQTASYILSELGFDERTCELAKIAAYMHDIGNTVNRCDHAQSGAIMAFQILTALGMETKEVALITCAIGHHDEGTASPVSAIAAALIIADKCDVRRSRVRHKNTINSDIHDRVNFAVEESSLELEKDTSSLMLNVKIDTEICAVMDYFEIFLSRMDLCKKSAEYLNLTFELIINNSRLL